MDQTGNHEENCDLVQLEKLFLDEKAHKKLNVPKIQK